MAKAPAPSKPLPKPQPQEWWEKGVQFECQGSGKCCVSRGEYGFVYMTGKDRVRMAKVRGLKTKDFMEQFCEKTDGVWHLREDRKNGDCIFLEGGNRCGVYEGRPDQCRTWPFWPEVMNAKTWKKEVAAFCPGIGKGRTYTADEIRATIAKQAKSEDDLVNGR
jgi:uncharacterized protein